LITVLLAKSRERIQKKYCEALENEDFETAEEMYQKYKDTVSEGVEDLKDATINGAQIPGVSGSGPLPGGVPHGQAP